MPKNHLSPLDTDLVFSSIADCSVSHEERAQRLAPLANSARPSCKRCAAPLIDIHRVFAAHVGSFPLAPLDATILEHAHVDLFWHLVDVHVYNRVKRFDGQAKTLERDELILKLEWHDGPSFHEINNTVQRSPLARVRNLRVILHRMPSMVQWDKAIDTMERHFGIDLPTKIVEVAPGRFERRWDDWADVIVGGETLVKWGVDLVNGTGPDQLPIPTKEEVVVMLQQSPMVREMGLMIVGKFSLN